MNQNSIMITEFEGYTTEGLPMELVAYYPAEAPAGTPPSRITGTYDSMDGGGTFDVEREADLPWVVEGGDFHPARSYILRDAESCDSYDSSPRCTPLSFGY